MATKIDMHKPVSGKTTVEVHPLVLLSVVDHFNRSCAQSKRRAVGVLLGSWEGNRLDVANSFAVPFEEDDKNPNVFFLDHDYLSNMFAMFRKVNAKEKIVGWYHTGPKLRPSDIQINEVLRKFVAHPILVIIDAQPKELGLPTSAYVSVEEVHDDGTPTTKTFEHVASAIGAEEAEEVGVEHLLRDIRGLGDEGTLGHRIQTQLAAVKGLFQRLEEIYEYITMVADGKLPMNHQISYLLQDIFNLLPNLELPEFITSMTVKTSDQLMVMYLASIIRATIALHNLINNKVTNMEAEQETEDRARAMEKRKEREARDAAKKEKEAEAADKEKEAEKSS